LSGPPAWFLSTTQKADSSLRSGMTRASEQ
jgi:hypothetical protein